LRAAFFDVDGTLTGDRTWKGFLDYFLTNKVKRSTHYTFLLIHYSLYLYHRLGLLSASRFRGIWAANMAWYVKGFSEAEAQAVWDWTVEKFLNQHWRTDIRVILNDHLNHGDHVVLVSSGPAPLIQRIAHELGTAHAVGTVLEKQNGIYTGRSLEPVCIAEHKTSLAKQYLAKNNLIINFEDSWAYADSIGDLNLLEMVGHPMPVFPEDELREIAIKRGWTIIAE